MRSLPSPSASSFVATSCSDLVALLSDNSSRLERTRPAACLNLQELRGNQRCMQIGFFEACQQSHALIQGGL